VTTAETASREVGQCRQGRRRTVRRYRNEQQDRAWRTPRVAPRRGGGPRRRATRSAPASMPSRTRCTSPKTPTRRRV